MVDVGEARDPCRGVRRDHDLGRREMAADTRSSSGVRDCGRRQGLSPSVGVSVGIILPAWHWSVYDKDVIVSVLEFSPLSQS
jgi:hypothetical protein